MKLKEYLIKSGINFEEKDGAITVGGGALPKRHGDYE